MMLSGDLARIVSGGLSHDVCGLDRIPRSLRGWSQDSKLGYRGAWQHQNMVSGKDMRHARFCSTLSPHYPRREYARVTPASRRFVRFVLKRSMRAIVKDGLRPC